MGECSRCSTSLQPLPKDAFLLQYLKSFPDDVQILIFNKLSIGILYCLEKFIPVFSLHTSSHSRFTAAARENGISVKKEHLPPALLIQNFLDQLQNFSFIKASKWDINGPEETVSDYGVNNMELSARYYFGGRYFAAHNEQYTFKFTLLKSRSNSKTSMTARRTRNIVKSKTSKENRFHCILGDDDVLEAVGNVDSYEFVLQNIESTRPAIAFDEHDCLYYCDREERNLKIYRKDLYSEEGPKLIYEFPRNNKDIRLLVYDTKLYLVMDRKVHCYDMRTTEKITSFVPNGIVFRAAAYQEGLVLLVSGSSWIFTLNKGTFKKLKIQGSRRKQLNRFTYLVARRNSEDFTSKVKYYIVLTFSFINGNVIEHYIQYCERYTLMIRYTDHVFALIETNRRYIWYEDQPGDKPILIHTDAQKTEIETYGNNAYPKSFYEDYTKRTENYYSQQLE